MKLNNSQYDTIMRMYDTRQSHARAVQNSRIEEINARIPEYDEPVSYTHLCHYQ